MIPPPSPPPVDDIFSETVIYNDNLDNLLLGFFHKYIPVVYEAKFLKDLINASHIPEEYDLLYGGTPNYKLYFYHSKHNEYTYWLGRNNGQIMGNNGGWENIPSYEDKNMIHPYEPCSLRFVGMNASNPRPNITVPYQIPLSGTVIYNDNLENLKLGFYHKYIPVISEEKFLKDLINASYIPEEYDVLYGGTPTYKLYFYHTKHAEYTYWLGRNSNGNIMGSNGGWENIPPHEDRNIIHPYEPFSLRFVGMNASNPRPNITVPYTIF